MVRSSTYLAHYWPMVVELKPQPMRSQNGLSVILCKWKTKLSANPGSFFCIQSEMVMKSVKFNPLKTNHTPQPQFSNSWTHEHREGKYCTLLSTSTLNRDTILARIISVIIPSDNHWWVMASTEPCILIAIVPSAVSQCHFSCLCRHNLFQVLKMSDSKHEDYDSNVVRRSYKEALMGKKALCGNTCCIIQGTMPS